MEFGLVQYAVVRSVIQASPSCEMNDGGLRGLDFPPFGGRYVLASQQLERAALSPTKFS